MEQIKIHGARIHNLKNIDLTIPKHKLIVITGISGSGKSSLAFDILFEEGKNQYLRSIGILSVLDNEDRFDSIEGIGPAVAVRQNTIRQSNPRSTVGSKTGILNQLALLYAADGRKESAEESGFYMKDSKNTLSPSDFLYTTADGMCARCQGRGSYFDVKLENLVSDQAMTLQDVYEKIHVTPGFMRLWKKKYKEYFTMPFWQLPEDIRDEVVYGTYENGKQSYCIERIIKNAYDKGEDVEDIYDKTVCPECHGERVSEDAGKVLLHGKRIGELGQMTLTSLQVFLQEIPKDSLSVFSRNVVKNIIQKLQHLIRFRLGHLSLYREMSSLSGGEVQRVFLHMHLESKMDSLIYVFDEPMAGLHPCEKQNMIEAVLQLRDLGNTVIVVEHDKEMIQHADHIIEIGPKAGNDGGNVVYQGDYAGYVKSDTLLSGYISGKQSMPKRALLRTDSSNVIPGDDYDLDCLILEHANTNYLKDLTVKIPLHRMVGVAGVSGSGKSSLVEDTLLKRLISAQKHGASKRIKGAERINGFVTISQDPIGRSASSTPASYIGIWDKIRELFAQQPQAINNQMNAGYFSFHSKGACPACNGTGYDRIFLTSDFSVDKMCPECHGKRFMQESLSVKYRNQTIAEVLEMSISKARSFFSDQDNIERPLAVLEQMGMGYLTLGQPTSSLSGGEAQRLKLAKELGRIHKPNLLYILDEPTTGLSMYDTALLIQLLDELVKSGNSVLVIEHNTDVLRNCDYLIELGPQGGDLGGEIIATGIPSQLVSYKESITGRYLA